MSDPRIYGDTVRLIYLRKKKRLTLQGMAALVGVSRATLTNIERGRTRMSCAVLNRISNAMMIEPAWLYGEMPMRPIAYVAGYVPDTPDAEDSELDEIPVAVPDFEDGGLGSRIREARLSKGWKIGELAERLNRDYFTVWRYEYNLMKPADKILAVMAEELGVSVHWLLTGEKAQFPITREILEFLQDHPEVRKMLTERVESEKAQLRRDS